MLALDDVSQKKSQMVHHNEAFKKRFLDDKVIEQKGKITSFLGGYMFNEMVSLYSSSLVNKMVLDAGCGSGNEAEYFTGLGINLIVTDISVEGIKCTKRRLSQLNRLVDGVVADTEHLPFKTGAFDVALAYDSLHHLPHPLAGVQELNRASVDGFIFRESQPTFWLTCLSCFINLKFEESGNQDFRFPKKLLSEKFSERGLSDFRFKTFFDPNASPFVRKYIYPRFNGNLWFKVFRWFFIAFNQTFGAFGNALVVVVCKKRDK